GVAIEPTSVPLERVDAGHGQIAAVQGVTYDEVDTYYELAADAAAQSPAVEDCTTRECAETWATTLLHRAFRGADDEATLAHYLGVLDDPRAGDDINQRLVTLVAAALSSPQFLYRQEIGTTPHPSTPSLVALTPHEVATRLAFLVWGVGPDDALLAEADAGGLLTAEQRLAALTRMLDDPRAASGLAAFVHDWMGLYQGGIDTKDPEVLASTPAGLASLAATSYGATVESTLFEEKGSFASLVSLDHFYVDEAVASVIGLDASGADLSRVELPPERQSLLLHPHVVAAHSKESGVSPFLQGEFVYQNLLCLTIGVPDDIPALEEEDLGDVTLREQLEAVTSPPACQTCHSRIGPSGFAFLPFDPIGRYSTEDGRGRPWDTTGSVPVGDEELDFDGAAELLHGLAEHPELHRCVARRMFRWTYGMFESDADGASVSELEEAAVEDATAVEPLLRAIVGAELFGYVRKGGA
ncbi:MAG: DUF1592 domain-containing protein, partial [Myxococcota bacterium]